EALISAGRQDLIGYEPRCLIRPRKNKQYGTNSGSVEKSGKQRRLTPTRAKPVKKQTRRS
ncbi:MAG: putative radical protein YgiQ, partial [Sporomusa sp.]|nr:putative radical protein YgiQ [Sporomusa sp.]